MQLYTQILYKLRHLIKLVAHCRAKPKGNNYYFASNKQLLSFEFDNQYSDSGIINDVDYNCISCIFRYSRRYRADHIIA